MKTCRTNPKRILRGLILLLSLSGGACQKDKDNNPAAVDKPSSLATVVLSAPVNGATNVAINRKVAASFSVAMDATTLTELNFKLEAPNATAVAGTVSYEALSKTAIFTPSENLSLNTLYSATVTKAVSDAEGKALALDHTWSFTTGTTPDARAPEVNSTLPLNGATGVAINGAASVTFDEEIDPLTVGASTLTLKGPNANLVQGDISYTGTSLTIRPSSDLLSNSLYTVWLTTEVKDLAGNALANAYSWTFTTGSTTAKGPAPVVLGTAADYVILAKSAVSTTGATRVVGNIGVSPAARSFLTGFSETLDATNVFALSSLVNGKLFAADMALPSPSQLTTAISNMETAYTDAAGRTLPDFTELGAGDVSGQTLVPGLYKWGTGLLLASNVTLSGSEHDVWIFQIAQDLTVSNGVQLTLAGGALAKNIFWQVAGQVILGTTATFNGNVLSQTQIVLQTGAVLNGRALAQTAVTLDANAVTKPSL